MRRLSSFFLSAPSEVIDAHEIIPGLWQGSRPPIGLSVAKAGFDVLVLCARNYQPPAKQFPGVKVLFAPNEDQPHMPMQKADLKIAVLVAHEVVLSLQKGSKVLVTCFAGINRSALVVALAINEHLGFSGNACIKLIRKMRRLDDPWAYSLSNPYFIQALERLPGT